MVANIRLLVISTVICGNAVCAADRPNILFCIADDWGWPDASAYGNPAVKTPAFDRLAREGVLFEHAFVGATSCTPSRNCILTGQWVWRLGEGANQRSTLHPKHAVFPLVLQRSGYHIGHWRKSWGPGKWADLGRTEYPVGREYSGFAEFLEARPDDAPFCFWLGASDPHRPYEWQSGSRNGIDIAKVRLPAALPDHETIRHDVADYLLEVQRFDADVAATLQQLVAIGELDNTIVVVTGDHGMPFPRHKCHLYDSGARVPLVIRWGMSAPAGRRVTDFVSLTDLAPTFLEAAGLEIPAQMTGRSLLQILQSRDSGRIEDSRDHTLIGRERHAQDQEAPETGGYPMRALRTDGFLYIRNFEPTRWPAGSPDISNAFCGLDHASCDRGPSKDFFVGHRYDVRYRKFYELAFGKRPAEELYDLDRDPDQLKNVAYEPGYAATKRRLADRLNRGLVKSSDPRSTGEGNNFDGYPFRR